MRMRSLHETIKNGRTERALRLAASPHLIAVSLAMEKTWGRILQRVLAGPVLSQRAYYLQLKGANRSSLCRIRSV